VVEEAELYPRHSDRSLRLTRKRVEYHVARPRRVPDRDRGSSRSGAAAHVLVRIHRGDLAVRCSVERFADAPPCPVVCDCADRTNLSGLADLGGGMASLRLRVVVQFMRGHSPDHVWVVVDLLSAAPFWSDPCLAPLTSALFLAALALRSRAHLQFGPCGLVFGARAYWPRPDESLQTAWPSCRTKVFDWEASSAFGRWRSLRATETAEGVPSSRFPARCRKPARDQRHGGTRPHM